MADQNMLDQGGCSMSGADVAERITQLAASETQCLHSDVTSAGIEHEARHNCPLHKDFVALIDELKEEKARNEQVRKYARAMGVAYPFVVAFDYTNDTFDVLDGADYVSHLAGLGNSIDYFVNAGADSIPDPELSREFRNRFNRQAVIDAFKAGKRDILLRHPQLDSQGNMHYMENRVVCTEFSDTQIEGICISRNVDDEAERDRAVYDAAQHAKVVNSLSTIYTTIMVADIQRHGYKVVKSVDLMQTATGGQPDGNFDEVMGSVLDHFMHPDSREEMGEFLNLGTLSERLDGTDTLLTFYKNPVGRWFEARFIAHERDAEGRATYALYVARDATDEREREISYQNQLREAATEAEKANVSKTNFLRRMSHDIRTPLNGIVGMLHIAEKYRGDQVKTEECMDKVLRSTSYLLDLVNNVLDISKLESGSIVLEHKPFDLGQLLLNTLPVVESYAGENSVAFKGGRSDTHIEHRFVVGSPVHLNRILMNIASNAVKYNRTGGYLRLYATELACDGATATYEFVCEDTGMGMSEEFQKRAFEPFSQEGKETITSFSGSGLGLSIVHDIVEMMGGTIDLKSQENVGTTIRVVLSFDLDARHGLGDSSLASVEMVDLSGQKALLVEDNGINLEIASIFLEEKGLTVVPAENGKEALDAFEASAPYEFDYIFMDMMMPVMDGLEATRQIRALDRPDAQTVPIIAMTANAFAEDRQACLEAGMDDHIGKPIDAITLNSVIAQVAGRKKARQSGC